jgi:hypothetical protein
MRLYIGERQVGEEPRRPVWEQTAVRIAKTLGTAAGTAIATRVATLILQRVRERGKES